MVNTIIGEKSIFQKVGIIFRRGLRIEFINGSTTSFRELLLIKKEETIKPKIKIPNNLNNVNNPIINIISGVINKNLKLSHLINKTLEILNKYAIIIIIMLFINLLLYIGL
ncbi:MAG: hypothetical protein V6009_01200 [Candidatus Dasytiphilus stammeri]